MGSVARIAIHEASRDVDHTAARAHQALSHRAYLLHMTGPAGLTRIIQQAGERGHARMRVVLCRAVRVAAMAQRAIVGSKTVRLAKATLFIDMTIVAIVTFRALPGKQGDGQKTQENQATASHIEIVIVRML